MGVSSIVLVPHIGIALFTGTYGWDDGAITLAFARTFADPGHIALTPGSEVVEGFSSPLWFLLAAAGDRALPLGSSL